MSRQDVLDALAAFLAGEPPLPKEDDDLFETGRIDSFKMIALVIHLEERFGVKFAEQDLTGDSFKTLKSITDLVIGAHAAA
jgi:acyl carrier protein